MKNYQNNRCEINKKVFEQANVNISLAGLENYIELINNDF